MTGPDPALLLELDDETRSAQLDRVTAWLAATRTLQTAYRKLLDDTVGGVAEPHIREYLAGLARDAREHEVAALNLYRAFGREPQGVAVQTVVGAATAKVREVVGTVEGALAGGRGGSWRKLRELLLSNLDATSGFAVTEQLGLALGIPAVVDITFPVVRRKTEQQLLLREYLLETASVAILYQRDT